MISSLLLAFWSFAIHVLRSDLCIQLADTVRRCLRKLLMLMSSAGNLGCQATPQPRGAELDRRGLGRTAALQLVQLRI